MPQPIHLYASHPVHAPSVTVNDALRRGVDGLIVGAAREAVARVASHARRIGLSVSMTPGVTARQNDGHEFGAVDLAWSGDEDATGWPALSGRLVVEPDPGGSARIGFVSPRSPQVELQTARLERPHRRRLVQLAIQGFLRELAGRLPRHQPPGSAASQGATRFDQAPVFLHDLLSTTAGPDVLLARIHAGLDELAATATLHAIAKAQGVLAQGRFRHPPAPGVHARPAHPGELGCARVRWNSEEEATGWPSMDLVLQIEPHHNGARLAALASRPPGYDLSLPQVDKHQRHAVLQTAARTMIGHVLQMVGITIEAAPAPEVARDLVGAVS